MSYPLRPDQMDPESNAEATTLAVNDSDEVVWVTGSVPTVLLPAGSVAADMATYAPNAPYGTIVRIKA
jgi:hypothetical protein